MAGRPRICHSVTGTPVPLRTRLLAAFALAMLPGALGAAENNPRFQPQLPDLELLEFLGTFATDEGEWIDPDSLLDNNIGGLLDVDAGSAAGNSGPSVNGSAANDSAQDSDND